MKTHAGRMILIGVLAASTAGWAQAMSNTMIDCWVDITWSFGTLGVQLSQSTWDLGAVPQGGVKDTWFGETTHGKFWVRNSGDTNAAFFAVAREGYGMPPLTPCSWAPPSSTYYAMGIATNLTDLFANWEILNQNYGPNMCGRFMRYLLPGDYMLFDLRFYAGPQVNPGGNSFRVGFFATFDESQTPLP